MGHAHICTRRLYMIHTTCLGQMDLHRLAGYSDEDEETRTPSILRGVYATPGMWVMRVTLSSAKA